MAQNRAHIDRGGNDVQKQGPGDMTMDQKKVYVIAGAGAQAIPAEAVLAGIISRTGPVAGFADTFPTAAALLAACPQLGVGDAFEFLYINTVAQVLTPGASAGVTLVNAGVAASAVRRFMVTVLADGVASVESAATTNGSNAVTLTNPRDTRNLRPGMLVTGTGVPGGATVAAVNQTTGVVTLSANATATNGVVALTFTPSIEIRGLYSATA